MIPKVIHYCWLSSEPMPHRIRQYMATWDACMPDYELRLWDFNRFPRGKSAWVDNAFDCHKYAFAADYIRCYALYHEGGIYLDTDVEVLRSFDDLLNLPQCLCYENGSGYIEGGVLASEAGNPIFGKLLEKYDHTAFNPSACSTMTFPRMIGVAIQQLGLKVVSVDSAEDVVSRPGEVAVLSYDYFSPIHNVDCRMMLTERTHAIHRFAGSWNPWYRRAARSIKGWMGPSLARIVNRLMHRQS